MGRCQEQEDIREKEVGCTIRIRKVRNPPLWPVFLCFDTQNPVKTVLSKHPKQSFSSQKCTQPHVYHVFCKSYAPHGRSQNPMGHAGSLWRVMRPRFGDVPPCVGPLWRKSGVSNLTRAAKMVDRFGTNVGQIRASIRRTASHCVTVGSPPTSGFRSHQAG